MPLNKETKPNQSFTKVLLLLNRIIWVKQQFLKPFNSVQTDEL